MTYRNSYGFSISHEEVLTGEDTLTELEHNKVDLVIVAMSLVDMTALTVAQKIKAIASMENLKIVVITED